MKRLLIILALGGLGLGLAAQAAQEVHEYRLDNGMQVFVKPDRRAPIAVSQVWYRVGASYEPDGRTGISHVLEHMMFKGTEKYGPNEFSRIIAENGGEENAFTGPDYTAYFQTMAADRIEVSFELEADRMRNLLLRPEEFAKEVEVVKEERRLRTEDKPNALTYEQFKAVAYRSLPYANPVIGWMNDLENLEAKDLGHWYRKWYAPNNAALVVVGDVDPERMFELAKQHFGPLKAETLPESKRLREPPQRGIIRTEVKAPARQPYLVMGYKTPVLASVDEQTALEPYALEMLAGILDGGQSARLKRELVRGAEIATSASASYSAFTRLPGMLTLSGVPAEGYDVADLEQAFTEQTAKLRTELVSAEELERVRNQVIASQVYELDSVFYQALQIGLLETVGLDWRLIDQYAENLRQVTAEQVRDVARKHLIEDQLTVAILNPQPIEEPAMAARQPSGGRHGG